MILHHLKDSLHWLHLFWFKEDSFEREAYKLARGQVIGIFLKVYLWLFLCGLLLLCGVGLTCELAGNNFHWQRALTGFATPWLICGLLSGLFVGLTLELLGGLFVTLIIVLPLELTFLVTLEQDLGARFIPVFSLTSFTSFGILTWRPYYWPFYFLQLWRARRSGNWLASFRHSPVYWDETIRAVLPWLSDWLFEIAKADRKEGIDEVLWVAENRRFQRKAAQKALLKLVAYDLRELKTVAQLAEAGKAMELFPIGYDLAPQATKVIGEYLDQIPLLAQEYRMRQTPNGQHKALLDLQSKLQSFQKAMALLPAPVGLQFQEVATQWLTMVNAVEAELRERLPLSNPYIVGNPLKEEDRDLFKGRRDLIVKLEEAIFAHRPSLLLYGRRRTGKTSALLNLPRLMSSQFVPVFIDCQNARWSDSDAMFCYHLTRSLYDELTKRRLAEGLAQPDKSEFAQHSFTRLDEFLDEMEAHSRRIGKQILLTFDEYERLEEGIRDGKLTSAVLNQIRAIVQHRERFIVLFSGSHRFEELQTVNWSDYLINAQTLHISFLARDEARELIEHPTPEFALGYEPGVVDRVLDLTHGQPYLTSALVYELVNLINKDKRKQASIADLDVAIDRTLSAVESYFENNWRDCNEQEQAMLCSLPTGQADNLSPAERQRALSSLSRKELVEQRDGQWQFTVELFRLWIEREKIVEATAWPSQPDNQFVSAFQSPNSAQNLQPISSSVTTGD